MQNNAANVENNLMVPQKLNHIATIWPNKTTLRSIPNVLKNLYTNAHNRTKNSQNMETTQIAISELIDKKILICTYNKILIS
jgi:hypothetical protein